MSWGVGEASAFSSRSHHHVSALAIGEVVGAALETVGPAPDLVVLTVSPGHAGALEDIAHVVEAALGPTATIGWVQRDPLLHDPHDAHAYVDLFAARCGPTRAVRLVARRSENGLGIGGLPASPGFHATTLLLAGRHPQFPLAGFATALDGRHPGLATVGLGVERGPLLVGGRGMPMAVVSDGAVGVLLGNSGDVRRGLVHAGHGIGDWWAVTEVRGRRVLGLGGRPVLDRLTRGAAAEHPGLLVEGLLGVVADEHHEDPEPDDVVLIPYTVDDDALLLSEPVAVGQLARPYALVPDQLEPWVEHHAATSRAGLVFVPNAAPGVAVFGDAVGDLEEEGGPRIVLGAGPVVLGTVAGAPRVLRAAGSTLLWPH